MSKVISKIKSLWADLRDKESRDEYVAARIATDLSHQIYALREQRGWTQGELADRCGHNNGQGWVSRLEGHCEAVTVKSLKQLASAFDVALSIKFVPFSQLANESITERLDKTVPGFDDDSIENCSPVFSLRMGATPTRSNPLSVRATPTSRAPAWHRYGAQGVSVNSRRSEVISA